MSVSAKSNSEILMQYYRDFIYGTENTLTEQEDR